MSFWSKWSSKFKTNKDDEEEKRIQKYEEQVENNPYGYGFTENDELNKIKWWQYLIFDMRFRIAYSLAIAILVGIGLPIAVYFIWFVNEDTAIYGSCMINENARFQCLINNAVPASRSSCIEAMCCWEEKDGLPYKCYHSFPSAYQYKASGLQYFSDGSGASNETDPRNTWIQLEAQPEHAERMSELKIWIKWHNEEHLSIQIFNPKDYPERVSASNSLGNYSPKKGPELGEIDNGNELVINYSDENAYFFIRLGRNGNDSNSETIFDTRLGPINSGDGYISFSTTLPTPFFYGLRGGEGISSRGSVTYGVVNGFENSELPFYMSLEASGKWHGVLLDTTLPFAVQSLQAPAVMFHVEGPKAEINLQVFVGPTKEEVIRQLHTYISSKLTTEMTPYVPTYWSLGLHLCRKSENASMTLEHLVELNEVQKIPYDSDCIDEDFRSPFGIDTEKFGNFSEIVDFLVNNATKRIVLSQKLAMPWNETEIENIQNMLIVDKSNASNVRPFTGVLDNQTVYYPDVFHPDFLQSEAAWGYDFGDIPVSGLIFMDNFPRNEKSIRSCPTPQSFLQKLLLNSTSLTSSERNGTYGSICPDASHNVTIGESNGKNDTTLQEKHFYLHNLYGQEAVKRLGEIAKTKIRAEPGRENETILISSSSGWTESLYYGGHNGMEVAFSWTGLRESLAHVIRSFVLSPFSGTPICGSYLPNESPTKDEVLCLRWYQVGLLLPFAYQTYGHANVSRGPLDFSESNQGRLSDAIRQRYTYAPYYYTLLLKYQDQFIPPITPVSFYFHNTLERTESFKLVDQFMIGEALLAAPIVKPDFNRRTYFPPSIWYDLDGYVAWDDTSRGGFKTVTGHLTQTPLFVRGGYVIPTQVPEGNSLTESRRGNYTLLVGLLPSNSSKGHLIIDNGIPSSSIRDLIEFNVTTTVNDSETEIKIEVMVHATNLLCDTPEESRTINQIKLLGFPIVFNEITVSSTHMPSLPYMIGDEVDFLRVYDLTLNWCIHPEAVVTINASKVDKS